MDTQFQHKTLPIKIGYAEYSKLSANEKADFVIVNNQSANINIQNTTTDDLLGLGKVAETAGSIVLLPFAVIKNLF